MSTAGLRAYDAAAVVIFAHNERAKLPFCMRGNMGFSALAERFEAPGYRIQRDADLFVITSARTQARAPHGFAHRLRRLGRSVAGGCA